MPIYEYRCDACGHTLDALQKVGDEHLTECPDCRESALRRLMSAPSFRLKGGGWYETDFKSDKEQKRNLVDSGEAKSKDKPKDKPKEGDGKSVAAEAKKGSEKSTSDKKTDSNKGKGSSNAVA